MVKALALLLCGAVATAAAVTEQSARRLPAAYVEDGSFESGETGGWDVKCKSAFSRVESGSGSGGPEQPKSGSHMLHFDGSRCPGKGGMSFTLMGLPEMVPMHVSMYIWLPEGDCTNDEMASKCPQLSYSKGNTNAGVGTMVTAIANQWNLISGTVFSDGGDVELILGNMPADSDLWFDDFAVANCGMEAFRAHSDAKIDEVRRRTTRVNIGKSGAETAKITMLKHEFPFGGAMWDDCVDSDNCKAFVKEHFNTIVAETGMKWWDEEPEDGDNTGTGEKYKEVARELGVELRAHSTYWEDNYKVQDWVKNLPRDGSRDSLQYAIWRRMQQYVERYGDQVSAFDVNNEMLHGTFYKDALPCGGDGPCMCDLEDACPDGMDVDRDADVHTWMYKAMKYLLPDSRRFINDYCQMHYCSKHFALAKLVKEARDIPDVTDMGVQGHLTNSMTVCGLDLMARFDHAVAAINGGATDGSASLRDLYDAPRKMWVTEMDMQDKDVTRRADGYETFYRAAYGSPGVAGVMTWGWREGHEWRPDIAMVGEDYRLTLEPGQRIFQGLLKGAWDASQDSTAVYPPDGEGDAPHVYFGAFPGTYTISAGGCTGSFTVPVGLGDYEVDAGNWEC